MCWHKWIVQKTHVRPIFVKLNHETGINTIFLCSAIFSALVIGLLTFLLRSSLEDTSMGVSGIVSGLVIGWGVLSVVIVFAGALSFDLLEEATKLKDKICLKCHLTILDASEAEIATDALEQKKLVREQEEENKLKTVDEVFKDRKKMWELAKKGQS